MTIEEQLDCAFRLRWAVCAISTKSLTRERTVIDQYLKFITPSRAKEYGANFPVACVPHPANPERAASGLINGKFPTLCFHVGIAVLGFYDGVKGIACPALEGRIELLERVARDGMERLCLIGSDATGYALSPTFDVPQITHYAIPDSEPVQGQLHDTGGAGGLRVPGSPLLLRS